MTGTLFELAPAGLDEFFARIAECRNKAEHVHALHPYPAKFIPHIPRALIGHLASAGDTVLDPMCGSGTTLVEATVAGHVAIGVDLNPIAALISRAKTTPLSADAISSLRGLATHIDSTATRIAAGDEEPLARHEAELPTFLNRDKWFTASVVRELAYAKAAIDELPDSAARDLARCGFSAILVAVSNQESETRWCAKPQAIAAGTPLKRFAARLVDSLERLSVYAGMRGAPASVHTADARALPLANSSADVVVSSPPYANSHDYYLYNKLRMFWLGEDVGAVQQAEIGSRNKHSDMKEGIETYVAGMSDVLRECHRVLRPAGAAAFVVADSVIRGEFFDMAQVFTDVALAVGFEPEASYRFGHRQFNSMFQRGFGTKREKQTHVLVYRAC